MAAATGRELLLCAVLLLSAAAVVQRSCAARPLLQQEAPADVVVIGLLHPAVVHADDAAGVIGDGAAREGGDVAGASRPFEDKRMSPGGPDPQHH
jgi:hypothetical protein